MKTSCNWLREYVDYSWDPARLAHELTMAGLEVEEIIEIGAIPDGVVTAKILSRSPHPDADRLSVCQVTTGDDAENLQIVCGAPNCDAGCTIALATIGTTLGPKFKIKKGKIRGVESFGMLCSAEELGLAGDSDGIMILPEDTPIGKPLAEVQKPDTVIDWEVTPNRPDWLSHIGIAREIGVVTGAGLSKPDAALPEASGAPIEDKVSVQVDAPDLCPRYTARLIEGVKIGPSPTWMVERLEAVGLRSINNVVDITNYVLLETGQPLHAFDYRDIADGKIIVRRAADGETIETLDEKTHELTTEHLLIADATRGVALAGVMGGANSEVREDTTTVLLESAAFAAANVRATSRGLTLITDSSYRFERGVDVDNVEYASARAAQLICELAGGTMAPGFIDVRTPQETAPSVNLRRSRNNTVIGVDVPAERIREILESLGCTVADSANDSFDVTAPAWRADLTREVDLIEEVARVYGLNNLPLRPAKMSSGGHRCDDAYAPLQDLRNRLLELGLDEAVSYTLISRDAANNRTGTEAESHIAVDHPLSAEYEVLRPTAIPSMVQMLAHNNNHGNHDLRLFEVARVYQNYDGPEERHQAAILISGRRQPDQYGAEGRAEFDFYDAKGLVEELFDNLNAPKPQFRTTEHESLRAGTATFVGLGRNQLAVFGEIDPRLTRNMRLRHPAYLIIVEVEPLLKLRKSHASFKGVPAFPGSSRDISFLADETLAHADAERVIRKAGGKLLESVSLFDIYRDEKTVGADRKSMAYTMNFRAPDRTLADKEVDKAMRLITDELKNKLNVEYR